MTIYSVLLVLLMVLLVAAFYFFISRKSRKPENGKCFYYLAAVGLLDALFGLFSMVLVQVDGPGMATWRDVFMGRLPLMEVMTAHALLLYTSSRFAPEKINKNWVKIPVLVFPTAMALVIFYIQWTGNLLSVMDNMCIPGPQYGIMYTFLVLTLGAVASCTAYHYFVLGAHKAGGVWELLTFMGMSMVFRASCVGVHTELVSGYLVTLGVAVIFLVLNNPYRCVDSLTSAFDQYFLRTQVKEYLQKQKKFCFLSVSLNQLHHINYVMGTETGNRVLIATCQMLMNSSHRNLVFRISGRRFLVLCPNQKELKRVTDRASSFFSRNITIGDQRMSLHAVLCTCQDAQRLGDCSSILAYNAYLEKQAKWPMETCLVESNSETMEGFHYQQEVESFLETAIEQDLFKVVFQPVYNMEQRRYTTMEALSRLDHPTLGPVSPAVFIDIAEKNDQIAKIAMLQLRRVCEFLTCNPEIQEKFQNVKVNVSPLELLKPGHIEKMLQTIEEYKIPLSFFQFEITESTAIEHDDNLDKIVEKFTQAGIGLCLDDFGSGYANLNSVMKLPFHTIKLDRSLLFGICQDPKVAGFYQSLVMSLHNMGFNVLAEGVETDQELELVSKWGVDMIQGFYFSRPLSGHVLMADVLKV